MHSLLPFSLLSSRANIDEVETEVVEIEAKLDKVRRLIPVTVDARYLSIFPVGCFQWQSVNSTLLSVGCNLEECCSSPCTVIQSKMFVSSLQGYTQLSTVRNNGAGQLITRHTHKSQINACTQEHSLLLDCFFYLIFFISYTFSYLLFKITNIRQDNYTSYR